jgi:RHS repeat-associated protein
VYDEGINAVLQFDGSSASNLSHRYLSSNNVDELLTDEQVAGSNTLWGLADHLGSLRDIADLNEGTGVTSITNHRTFNSFGKLISETNAAVDMLFAFTGKHYDDATALQHNLFRWYDPALGQWLSEDPLGFGAGDENVRRYVGNKVVNSIDPSGLQDPQPDNSSQSQQASQAAKEALRFADLYFLHYDTLQRQQNANPPYRSWRDPPILNPPLLNPTYSRPPYRNPFIPSFHVRPPIRVGSPSEQNIPIYQFNDRYRLEIEKKLHFELEWRWGGPRK